MPIKVSTRRMLVESLNIDMIILMVFLFYFQSNIYSDIIYMYIVLPNQDFHERIFRKVANNPFASLTKDPHRSSDH